MGRKFHTWQARSESLPQTFSSLVDDLYRIRTFDPLSKLAYGDHGLFAVAEKIVKALREEKRIALYADYDVDGTMSCVSWLWFLQEMGYTNYTYYIPSRMGEGYGVHIRALEKLIDEEGVELVITMDTGITAHKEVAYCRERGVEVICTDHHHMQEEKLPQCPILNPKQHPDSLYQELCGCGITYVLLREIGKRFSLPQVLWKDLLALAGLATICDVVPLNAVNHQLAKQGLLSLLKSSRRVFHVLCEACQSKYDVDERDIAFRIGPRINAVGRLYHAQAVIDAFLSEEPQQLMEYMQRCNDERREIQERIVAEAREEAENMKDSPILFLGGDWHPGVVGIAASKLVEEFWRPVWLFQRQENLCKGSARSIRGFDLMQAMTKVGDSFHAFGGHRAAGGFSFAVEREQEIREKLAEHAAEKKAQNPRLWQSQVDYDCAIPSHLVSYDLALHLEQMKPFGHGFEEPLFKLSAAVQKVEFYKDKQTGEPRHTAVTVAGERGQPQKILFFNEVYSELHGQKNARFLVSAGRNTFRGKTSLSLVGKDYELCSTPS